MQIIRVEGKRKGFCENKFCRNRVAPVSSRSCGICSRCKKRDYRERYPLRYAFQNLHDSARRRSIAFTLTLAEFEKFCKETNYLELKGRRAGHMHVDRKRSSDGYSADNIQLLECTENSSKGNRDGYTPRLHGSNGDHPF